MDDIYVMFTLKGGGRALLPIGRTSFVQYSTSGPAQAYHDGEVFPLAASLDEVCMMISNGRRCGIPRIETKSSAPQPLRPSSNGTPVTRV